MSKKRQDASATPMAGPFNSAFAGLAARRDALPAGESPPSAAAASPKPAPTEKAPGVKPAAEKASAKPVVVRYERKGHGGKEMTRLERLELGSGELAKWLKEAKQALGCGGVVDGDTILLQGDQRERAAAWLAKRNVRTTVS